MDYLPIDLALNVAVPVLPVPLHGRFVEMTGYGHRFLVASDGLYLEVRRDWVHVIWPVATDARVAKPFGRLTSRVRFECGSIPRWIKDCFAGEARDSGNTEIAACVLWNSKTRAFNYRRCEAITANFARIEYVRPALGLDESLVVDLHSHGFGRAYFSALDDLDDQHEVKIAGVVGTVNSVPTWQFRLCVNGIFVNGTPDSALGDTDNLTKEYESA